MTNSEIDIRLRMMSDAIAERAKQLTRPVMAPEARVARELELLNMSAMMIYAMLGEIAKRLPEVPA